MQQYYLSKHESNTDLVLFFSGWGGDAGLCRPMVDEACDLMVCYDYRSLSFDEHVLAHYRHATIVAWSLGVWVAEHLPALKVPAVAAAYALNGTPFPIDAEKGIAPSIFYGTLDGMSVQTLDKFRKRMCNTHYAQFMQQCTRHSAEELKDELASLAQNIESPADDQPSVSWTKAYIGSRDRIFIPQNQRAAWAERHVPTVEITAMPHYAPELFMLWKNS